MIRLNNMTPHTRLHVLALLALAVAAPAQRPVLSFALPAVPGGEVVTRKSLPAVYLLLVYQGVP